jgi:hypothetical protein
VVWWRSTMPALEGGSGGLPALARRGRVGRSFAIKRGALSGCKAGSDDSLLTMPEAVMTDIHNDAYPYAPLRRRDYPSD